MGSGWAPLWQYLPSAQCSSDPLDQLTGLLILCFFKKFNIFKYILIYIFKNNFVYCVFYIDTDVI